MTRLRPVFLLASLALNLVAVWLLAQSIFRPLPEAVQLADTAPIQALILPPPPPSTPEPKPLRNAAPEGGQSPKPEARQKPAAPLRATAPVLVERQPTPGVEAGQGRVGLYGALSELAYCRQADLLFNVSQAQVEHCEAQRVFAQREAFAPLPLPGQRLFEGAQRAPGVGRRFSRTCAESRSGLDCLD